MIVKLKYIGLVTEKLPTILSLDEGTDLAGLIQVMKDEYGEHRIDTIVKKSTFLVGKSKLDDKSLLMDGDEVMILSVLGGG